VPNVAGKPGEYYLVYFGKMSPGKWKFQLSRRSRKPPSELAGGMKFQVDVIDTWNMTITPVDGAFTLNEVKDGEYTAFDTEGRSIDVPDKPWMALRITKIDE
jgi:Domain of unknown function (DUF5605)